MAAIISYIALIIAGGFLLTIRPVRDHLRSLGVTSWNHIWKYIGKAIAYIFLLLGMATVDVLIGVWISASNTHVWIIIWTVGNVATLFLVGKFIQWLGGSALHPLNRGFMLIAFALSTMGATEWAIAGAIYYGYGVFVIFYGLLLFFEMMSIYRKKPTGDLGGIFQTIAFCLALLVGIIDHWIYPEIITNYLTTETVVGVVQYEALGDLQVYVREETGNGLGRKKKYKPVANTVIVRGTIFEVLVTKTHFFGGTAERWDEYRGIKLANRAKMVGAVPDDFEKHLEWIHMVTDSVRRYYPTVTTQQQRRRPTTFSPSNVNLTPNVWVKTPIVMRPGFNYEITPYDPSIVCMIGDPGIPWGGPLHRFTDATGVYVAKIDLQQGDNNPYLKHLYLKANQTLTVSIQPKRK